MKKIVLCSPSLITGGAERFVADLALRLQGKQYEVIVAQTRQCVQGVPYTMLEQAGIRIVDLSAGSYPAMLRRQLAFFKAERPDIVHTNTGSVLHIMLACMLCRIPRRVYTMHNEAGLLTYGKVWKKWLYQLAFSVFGFIPVAICPFVKETIARDLGVKREKIPVVNNGVDVDRFTPPEEKVPHSAVRFVSVGSLYWIKNQAAMIRLVSDLRQAGKDATLTLLGDGEDRAELEKLIAESGADSFVLMPGIRNNVEDYLRDADVYLSASRTEGLPLSILEAMACGLPVIATDAGGTRDIVHDGENGYLVPVDDEQALMRAAEKLCEDSEQRRAFAAASRSTAQAWSLQACVEGYVRLYEG